MFLCVPYHADGSKRLRPDIPKRCGLSTEGECVIWIKGQRSRIFGPEFRLTVVCCRTHRVSFTLYPPGFTPYGRKPMAVLSSAGFPQATDTERRPFEGTLFQAVLDGAAGDVWPKESLEGHLQSRFNTQLKHIDRCCLLLGLGRGSPPTFDEILAHSGVEGQILHELRGRVMAREGYRVRCEAACQLLSLTTENQNHFIGTCTLGYLAGLWPKPQVSFPSRNGNHSGSAYQPWI